MGITVTIRNPDKAIRLKRAREIQAVFNQIGYQIETEQDDMIHKMRTQQFKEKK